MSDEQKVWELMDKIGICMLTSWDGQELQARPMHAYVRPSEQAIYMLADGRHHKEEDIKKYNKVCLAFSDTSAQKYVSLSGQAEFTTDPQKVRELWDVKAKAWWSSPDDTNIRLLRILPIGAEYWDLPGSAVSYIKMAVAAVTGSRPSLGENRDVPMR